MSPRARYLGPEVLEEDLIEEPWYIVPADDEANARLIVSRIILDTLSGLKMSYPKLSKARQRELQSFRNLLVR